MIVSNDRFDDPAKSNSAGGRDFSKLWPIALILAFGILLFCFSKDMLSIISLEIFYNIRSIGQVDWQVENDPPFIYYLFIRSGGNQYAKFLSG